MNCLAHGSPSRLDLRCRRLVGRATAPKGAIPDRKPFVCKGFIKRKCKTRCNLVQFWFPGEGPTLNPFWSKTEINWLTTDYARRFWRM